MKGIKLFVMILVLSLALTVFVRADPTAPSTLTQVTSSSFSEGNYALQTHNAIAGNITGLTIYSIGQTRAWQGYYGNITGTITLDDANNFTFYNWTASEPRGQIYATLTSSVTWSDVECFNFTAGGTPYTNWSTIETFYNIATDDVDGTNETYTANNHPTFQVASNTQAGCPTSYVFQNDVIQSTNFVNVLLMDPNAPTNGWIYTTLIENKTSGSTNDLTCYNGQPCDFQLLVNEDGHGTDTSTTTYYFWVELA